MFKRKQQEEEKKPQQNNETQLLKRKKIKEIIAHNEIDPSNIDILKFER